MSNQAINAMMEYLDKHNVGEFAVDGPDDIEGMNLSRRDRRDILAGWEALQDDLDAPPGVAGIVAHNIDRWADNLWPGQGNRRRSVIMTYSEVESLVDFIEQTAPDEWTAHPSFTSARAALSEWLPKVRAAR
jgi:hypothetical protein